WGGEKPLARREERNADRRDHLPRSERGLAIAGDEGFDRQRTRTGARSERHSGIERNQAGNRVADGGRGREIAGDGAEIADLPRADAAHERCEGWKMPIE